MFCHLWKWFFENGYWKVKPNNWLPSDNIDKYILVIWYLRLLHIVLFLIYYVFFSCLSNVSAHCLSLSCRRHPRRAPRGLRFFNPSVGSTFLIPQVSQVSYDTWAGTRRETGCPSFFFWIMNLSRSVLVDYSLQDKIMLFPGISSSPQGAVSLFGKEGILENHN